VISPRRPGSEPPARAGPAVSPAARRMEGLSGYVARALRAVHKKTKKEILERAREKRLVYSCKRTDVPDLQDDRQHTVQGAGRCVGISAQSCAGGDVAALPTALGDVERDGHPRGAAKISRTMTALPQGGQAAQDGVREPATCDKRRLRGRPQGPWTD
jgi:hypothetical protein